MSDILNLGFESTFEKLANPAAPVKSSKDGMERTSPSTPYLNMGGGKAQQQQAGKVKDQPQPWPGYVNHSKDAPVQSAGDVGGRGGSPDTGELGMGQGGDMTVTKSAAFDLGMVDMLLALGDDDA